MLNSTFPFAVGYAGGDRRAMKCVIVPLINGGKCMRRSGVGVHLWHVQRSPTLPRGTCDLPEYTQVQKYFWDALSLTLCVSV